LDRRRRQHHDACVLDHVERLIQAGEQGRQVLPAASLAPILQDDVGDAGARQRRRAVEHGNAGDGDDLRNARSLACNRLHLIERLLRALQRCAVGQLHIGDQVTLVFDRQKAGRNARERKADDRDENQRRDHPHAAARDDASDQPRIGALQRPVQAIEEAEHDVAFFNRQRLTQPQRALCGLQRRRIDGAEQRGGRNHQRELRVHPSGETGQESRRNEHRHQNERDADDRAEQLLHGLDRGVVAVHAFLDIVGGAFDHDDGVVNDNADRQHDGEQCGKIDGEAERRHGGERADDGDRHRGRRHERRAPVLQEEQDDDQHQDACLEQGLVDLVDRGAHEFRGVERDPEDETLRKLARQLAHLGVDRVAHVERIGPWRLEDRHSRRRVAVEREHLPVGLGAKLDPADVADARGLPLAARLHDDIGELLGVVEPAEHVEGVLERCP
jgi:hypothetical protein